MFSFNGFIKSTIATFTEISAQPAKQRASPSTSSKQWWLDQQPPAQLLVTDS
jgi:hypothetical protein